MAIVKPRGLRFVKRVYPARTLGLGLGALTIAAVLYPLHTPFVLWLALFASCFIWPHIAYSISSRSTNPYLIERLQLLADVIMGGFWVAAMGFNPLASSILTMMLWMNIISAGGISLFLVSTACSFTGLFLGVLVFGIQWHPQVSDALIYASIPMLIFYPILIGSITYNLSMELHKQKESHKHLSRMDGLTGVFNRSYWESRAREEIVRTRRNHNPLSLILIDIDHFKRINDTYGHAVGDYVLRQVAQCLQGALREHELLGRYGGEEFAIILPDEDGLMAFQLAERLRKHIEQVEFQDPADPSRAVLSCTISVGVAAFSDGNGDFSSWIRAADAVLYQAKREGRNRCVRYINTHPKQDIENS